MLFREKPGLRARLIVDESAKRLANYLAATVDLMKLLARGCGHARLGDVRVADLMTVNRDIAYLTGVKYAGVVPL